MASRAPQRSLHLPPPYLKRIWQDPPQIADAAVCPFCLSLFARGFELTFSHPITIIIGENGAGKSTLLEGIAELAGFGTHALADRDGISWRLALAANQVGAVADCAGRHSAFSVAMGVLCGSARCCGGCAYEPIDSPHDVASTADEGAV